MEQENPYAYNKHGGEESSAKVAWDLLAEEEVREKSRRRGWIGVRLISLALLPLIISFVLIVVLRGPANPFDWFGPANRDFVATCFLALLLVSVLSTIIFGSKYLERLLLCPACDADLSVPTEYLLRTRCCPKCENRVVEGGRVRSRKTYQRYQQIRQKRFLERWLWIWPIIVAVMLLLWFLMPNALGSNATTLPCLFSFVGTTVAGWTCLRTSGRRYAPQFLISLGCLALSVMLFWSNP